MKLARSSPAIKERYIGSGWHEEEGLRSKELKTKIANERGNGSLEYRDGLRPLWARGQKRLMGPHHVAESGGGIHELEVERHKN